MSNLEFRSPLFAPDATRHLWTPTDLEYLHSWVLSSTDPMTKKVMVARTTNGEAAVKHEFRLKYRGETVYFGVVGLESDPDSQVEDNAAWQAEVAARDIDDKLSKRGGKLLPEQLAEKKYWDEKRDLAGAMRDMLKHAKKRADSTNGRLFYAGLK